ncbi:sugar ABC transporter substrate-binding protein [Paracoccus versutus]|uniref:Monosaccharide ABC transporter substrate-binding protein (CUT2 family) n=1 Tax=Paracoccus versutus TaxID=34007 RepID=A0A3D9XYF2_PARVE|nr:sugar ABC transporter substrate-binding protein [Paracoccus versutus]REF73292.1 monosaccharide ABC transporter substrate-binding protein (CUT2 family) [Paracoccus versutus]
MNRLRKISRTLGVTTSLVIAGTAAQADGTVAVIVTNFQNVAEVSMAEGFSTKAKELGYDVVEMDSKGSVERQANAIDDAIAQGVKGIAAIVLDSAVAASWVDNANDMDVKFSAMAVQVGDPSNPWSEVYPGLASLVGRDDYATGARIAKYATSLFDEGKPLKIGLVEGMPGYSTVINLTNGFKAGLEEAGVEYEIVMSQPTDWTQVKGQEVCQNALTATPDIDLFYAHAQTMAVGCADAVDDVGSQAKIVTAAGGLALGHPYVQRGQIAAAVCEPWHEIGARTAETLIASIDGTDVETPQLVTLELPIYTAENVDSCKPEW